eukprot:g2267.t1
MLWSIEKGGNDVVNVSVRFDSSLCPNPHRVTLNISDQTLSPPFRFHCDPKHPLNSRSHVKYRRKYAVAGFEELTCVFGVKNTFSVNRCLVAFVERLLETFHELKASIEQKHKLSQHEALKLLALLHFVCRLSQSPEGSQALYAKRVISKLLVLLEWSQEKVSYLISHLFLMTIANTLFSLPENILWTFIMEEKPVRILVRFLFRWIDAPHFRQHCIALLPKFMYNASDFDLEDLNTIERRKQGIEEIALHAIVNVTRCIYHSGVPRLGIEQLISQGAIDLLVYLNGFNPSGPNARSLEEVISLASMGLRQVEDDVLFELREVRRRQLMQSITIVADYSLTKSLLSSKKRKEVTSPQSAKSVAKDIRFKFRDFESLEVLIRQLRKIVDSVDRFVKERNNEIKEREEALKTAKRKKDAWKRLQSEMDERAKEKAKRERQRRIRERNKNLRLAKKLHLINTKTKTKTKKQNRAKKSEKIKRGKTKDTQKMQKISRKKYHRRTRMSMEPIFPDGFSFSSNIPSSDWYLEELGATNYREVEIIMHRTTVEVLRQEFRSNPPLVDVVFADTLKPLSNSKDLVIFPTQGTSLTAFHFNDIRWSWRITLSIKPSVTSLSFDGKFFRLRLRFGKDRKRGEGGEDQQEGEEDQEECLEAVFYSEGFSTRSRKKRHAHRIAEESDSVGLGLGLGLGFQWSADHHHDEFSEAFMIESESKK